MRRSPDGWLPHLAGPAPDESPPGGTPPAPAPDAEEMLDLIEADDEARERAAQFARALLCGW